MATVQFNIQTNSAGAITGITAFTQALNSAGNAGQNAGKRVTTAFDRVEFTLNKMHSAVIGFIGAFVFSRVIRGINEIIKAGIDFEASFAGIKKTVDGSIEDFALLSSQMRQLAKDTGLGVNELNRIGESAGALGVHTEDIKEFTATVAKIGIATNLSTEEAATGFARLANILRIPVEQTKVLASVVVELGNKSAATEQEILDFSLRIAGAGTTVGMSGEKIAALAASLASVGLHAEVAGSATSRILIEMAGAVDKGGRNLDNFAKIAGVSTSAFADAFKKDAAGALLTFLSGLDTVKERGMGTFETLEILGLGEIRVRDVALRATQAHSEFAEMMRIAGEESKKTGEALDNEFNKKLDTTQAKLDMAKARLYDVAISISDQLKPSIVSAADVLAGFAETLRDNERLVTSLGIAVAGLGIAFGAVKAAQAIAAMAAIQQSVFALKAVLVGAATAWEGFVFALGTTGAIAAVTVSLGLLINKIRAYRDDLDAIEQARKNAEKQSEKDKKNIMKAVEEYAKYGVVIQTTGRELFQIENSLVASRPELLKRIADEKEAAKATEKHAAAIKLATEKDAERRERIQKIVDSVDMATEQDKEWLTALRILVESGRSFNAILDEQGGKIQSYVDRMSKLGRPLSGVIVMLNDFAEEQKRLRNEVELGNDQLDRQISGMIRAREAGTALNKAMQDWNAGVFHPEIEKEIREQPLRFLPGRSPQDVFTGMDIDAEKSRKQNEASAKAAEKYKQLIAQQNAIILSGLDRAVENLFEQLVKKGVLAWKDLARFASEIFEGLSRSLIKPLTDNLLKPMSDFMGGLGKKISGFLYSSDEKGGVSGILGGLGKKLGPAMAGVASAGIGAAISIGISTISSLLKKSGSEVNNKLVQDIQNPFTDAVGKLMDSFDQMRASGKLTLQTAVEARASLSGLLARFKADTSAYAALGEKQSIAVQNAFRDIEQYWGVDLSTLLGKIDEAIVELGGSAGMTTDSLKNMEEALKDAEDFMRAVDGLVTSVNVSSREVDVLAAALEQLRDTGVPTRVIIDRLGQQIQDMATQLRSLGREVPEVIANFELLASAISRQSEVEQELAATRKELLTTLERAMSDNNQEIERAQSNLEKWTDRINTLVDQYKDIFNKLNDAKYWQEQYTKAISDAERAYRDAKKEREDMEKSILDLTRTVERERLQITLDRAKDAMDKEEEFAKKARENQIKALEDAIKANDRNTFLSLETRAEKRELLERQLDDLKDNKELTLKTEAAYNAAKTAMDNYEAAERKRRTAEQVAELVRLTNAINEQRAAEDARRLELEAAKVVAQNEIETRKSELMAEAAIKAAEITQLRDSVAATTQRVAALQQENIVLKSLFALFGGEQQKTIWETIDALMRRGEELETERNTLSLLTGVAKTTNDVFLLLSGSMIKLGQTGLETMSLLRAAVLEAQTSLSVVRSQQLAADLEAQRAAQQSISDANRRAAAAAAAANAALPPGEVAPTTVSFASRASSGTAPWFTVPSYDSGGPTKSGLSMLHDNEYVVPEKGALVMREEGSGGVTFAPGSIVINQQPGQNGRELAHQFVHALEVNGDLRRRISELTKPRK